MLNMNNKLNYFHQGIWAGGVEDITCTASNHKFRLMGFGRNNSQGIVYSIDETTGGLSLSHKLILPTKDYPGCPGPVTGLRLVSYNLYYY